MAASSPPAHVARDARRARRERILDVLRTIVINLLFTALALVVGYSLVVTWKLKQMETAEKRLEVEAARQQLARDVETNDDLKRQIAFLRTEDGVEKIARERLGLIRPNESTYIVINAPGGPTAPRPRPTAAVEAEPEPSQPLTRQVWQLLEDVWNGGD